MLKIISVKELHSSYFHFGGRSVQISLKFFLEAVKFEADLVFSTSQFLTQCEVDARGDIYTELSDNCSEEFS